MNLHQEQETRRRVHALNSKPNNKKKDEESKYKSKYQIFFVDWQ